MEDIHRINLRVLYRGLNKAMWTNCKWKEMLMKTKFLCSSRFSVASGSFLIAVGTAFLFFCASPAQAHYTLTVSGGTIQGGAHSGSYSSGTKVTIIADNAPLGQVFDTWSPVSPPTYTNAKTATTQVTVDQTRTVYATYKNLPDPHPLTVNAGSGSGSFRSGDSVTIVGDSPGVGRAFSQWTWGTNVTMSMFDNINSSNTIFHMPNTNATVTALYSNLLYSLTVNGGLGSGGYATGTTVQLMANSGAVGQPFDQWTIQSGANNSMFTSIYSSNALFTMPASAVTITATYKPAHMLEIIGDGITNRYYFQGAVVTNIAARTNIGMVFNGWTINYGATSNMFSNLALSPTTLLSMPNNDVSISAGWTDADATNIYVSVANGTINGAASGYFQRGLNKAIVANTPAPPVNGVGSIFNQWTWTSPAAQTNFGNINSNSTSFLIPTSAVWIAATYTNIYQLTITNGLDGNGDTDAYYLPATVVMINGNDAPTNQVFLTWIGGHSNRFGNILQQYTAYVMEAMPAGIAATYINGLPNTNVNPKSLMTTYSLVSVGTTKGQSRVVMVNGMRQQTWAQYALWSDNNGAIYFVDGEQFYGWVHSNHELYFDGTPEFFERCTSSASSVGSGNSTTSTVTFHRGFNLNFPTNDVTTAAFSNMLGKADLVMTGKTAITFSGSTLLISNTNRVPAWTNYPYALPGDMTIAIRTNSAADCDLSVGGQLQGRVTVVAERDILITNHLTYACDPVTNSMSTDALGIIANRDVVVTPQCPNDLKLYAQIMATGLLTPSDNTDGSFGVQNYNSGSPRGVLNLYGGIAQNQRDPVGQVDGNGNPVHGYIKNYRYDQRFATVPPPDYPPLMNTLNFNQWKDQ
jgi:hypothetical protein